MCGRAILFNLRDPDNPDFRRRVLSGEVQPERVSMMDSVEMASDELKRQRSIYASISLQAVTQGSAEDQYAVCASPITPSVVQTYAGVPCLAKKTNKIPVSMT